MQCSNLGDICNIVALLALWESGVQAFDVPTWILPAPSEIWSAAKLDGVSVWRLYIEIIVPMLKFTFLTCAILLSLGFDAGGSPACSIDQFLPNGQNLSLHEICAQPGTGPGRFSEMVMEVLLARFQGFAIGEAWGDPSAFWGADRQAGELSFMETVSRALNINILPAPSNEPAIRQEAVRWYLGAPIDANTGGLFISPTVIVIDSESLAAGVPLSVTVK